MVPDEGAISKPGDGKVIPITDLGIAAILTAIFTAFLGYLRLRSSKKVDDATTPSEAYSKRASGDKTYVEMANDAWEWADYLRQRDYLWERWSDLIEPVLEHCAGDDPKSVSKVEAAKKLRKRLRAERTARNRLDEELENGRNGGEK